MKLVLTADEMKLADSRMIHEIGVPSLVLMERAALQCVETMHEEKCDFSHTLVVCGSGNNGGDGFAIARMLYEKSYDVDIVFVGSEKSRTAETIQQINILNNLGITIGTTLPDKEYSIIIDAVFGIGLCRSIEGRYKEVIERMNKYRGYKVAVDIASGVSADTGNILGTAFEADLTVTFAWGKIGHYLTPGCINSGKVVVKDIGITRPDWHEEKMHFLLDNRDLSVLMPERRPDSNKGTYGRLLVIAGSRGMSGAAYLAAKAAYKTGAGLVQIYTEESNRIILQQLLPEAIITTYDAGQKEPFDKLKDLLDWADNICLGSGIGISDLSIELVKKVFSMNTKNCVIDADGLNILAKLDECDLQHLNSGNYILTPHMKEMSRISGNSVNELKNDRLNLLKLYTDRYRVICVLKDSRTVVMGGSNPVFINTSGNQAMAKAGSGDVLAGIISGLLSQGLEPYKAAVTGVFLHGTAGDRARESCGSYSVLAEDLISGIEESLKLMEAQY